MTKHALACRSVALGATLLSSAGAEAAMARTFRAPAFDGPPATTARSTPRRARPIA